MRQARQGRLTGVKGKGGTERTVFLSADARQSLADYLEKERPRDAGALPDGDGDPGPPRRRPIASAPHTRAF